MFQKNMRLAYLFDFYIELFDEHTKQIMRAYYEDDLSLAEIAAGEGISRQGVRHIIKKCEEQILEFEEKLSLAQRYEAYEEAITKLKRLHSSIDEGISPTKNELLEVIEILEKGV